MSCYRAVAEVRNQTSQFYSIWRYSRLKDRMYPNRPRGDKGVGYGYPPFALKQINHEPKKEDFLTVSKSLVRPNPSPSHPPSLSDDDHMASRARARAAAILAAALAPLVAFVALAFSRQLPLQPFPPSWPPPAPAPLSPSSSPAVQDLRFGGLVDFSQVFVLLPLLLLLLPLRLMRPFLPSLEVAVRADE